MRSWLEIGLMAVALTAAPLMGCGGSSEDVPSCLNEAVDQDESDVDCGGSCSPCLDGKQCAQPGDCASGFCDQGTCAPAPSCTDNALNGDESDMDCGGSCPACENGQACGQDPDCSSGFCAEDGTCAEPASCTDQILNQDETDVDCGGSCDQKCGIGEGCLAATDCASEYCDGNGACKAPPSCTDGEPNQDETDIDCGGSCPKCADHKNCLVNEDCINGFCVGEVCVPPIELCTNGVKDGNETDVDCGGGTCDVCPLGYTCEVHEDCDGMVRPEEPGILAGPGDDYQTCEAGICGGPAVCNDWEQNGHETDMDCGGGICRECGEGLMCESGEDCMSGTCESGSGTCTAPEDTCSNGVQDGFESDEDCGGPCAPCVEGFFCEHDLDCEWEWCWDGVCDGDLVCWDGIINGHETDVDCGGGGCPDCRQGADCVVADDCGSQSCESLVCVGWAASCDSGVQDGDETDVDCGGPGCEPCADGAGCAADADCQTGYCNLGLHVCEWSIRSVQQTQASTTCTASGVNVIEQGIEISHANVASGPFTFDGQTTGWYLQEPAFNWPDWTDPRWSGILAIVDASATTALAQGRDVTFTADYEEHDCMSVLRIHADTVSDLASSMLSARTVPAVPFENGGTIDAEPYEGALLTLAGLTVTDAGGFTGTEGPGSPHWWFKLGNGIYVANDFGLATTVSEQDLLTQITGVIKYRHGVYLLVPRQDSDLVLAP